jgi:hypothetical protein
MKTASSSASSAPARRYLAPLAFSTPARQLRLGELQFLKDEKLISKADWNKEIQKMNEAETKMIQARQQKEEAKAKAQYEAFLRRLDEQEKKRKARMEEYNRLRKQKRAERKQAKIVEQGQTAVVFKFSYQYRYKNTSKVLTSTYEHNLNVVGNENVQSAVQKYIDERTAWIDEESPIIRMSRLNWTITSAVPIQREVKNKRTILMKSVVALDLDGEEVQKWDTGKGTCVYDFLIWRYGELKGCKKVCSYDSLDEIFRHRSGYNKHYIDCENCVIENGCYIKCEGCKGINGHRDDTLYYFTEPSGRMYYMFNLQPYNDSNPRDDGVCSHQLEFFCEKIGVHMYALDEREQIISHYTPTKLNKALPPLVYRIKDNHLYPILNRSQAIANKARKTDMTYITKEEEEFKEEIQKANMEVQILKVEDNTLTNTETMIQKMKDSSKQVYPFKNMFFDSKGLRGFDLDGVRYLFDEDTSITTAKAIADATNQPYTGESTFNIVMKLMEENNYTTKSIFNPFVFDLLTSEGIKHRTHYGSVVNDISGDFVPSDDMKCFDIAKCHTSILSSPMSAWLVYDFNDSFTKFNIKSAWENGRFRPGLYYVQTDDMTLLHKDNIYSHTILNKAMDEKILFNPVSQYLPSRKPLPLNHFKVLLDAIKTKCDGRPELMKVLTNIITGMLGKHSTKRYVARLNTDIQVVWNDFCDPDFNTKETFFYQIDNYYLYGYIVENEMVENNIPMYIQVLDQANIRLYDMTKATGAKLVWRKTDSIVVQGNLNPDFKYDNSSEPGSYRSAEFPDKMTIANPNRAVKLNTFDGRWILYPEITNSNQVDEVYALLRKYGGLCNVSRAGTGKSYNIMKIEEKFRSEFPDAFVKKIAFTNKACLNINGTTIHKFLKIDKSGKFRLDWLKQLNSKGILIMIDEISMIGQYLWRRLVELKKAVPNAHFLLCGDYRQVPPVEDDEHTIDYFNCSAVKYLANYTRIEFSVRQRYDEALWNFAEDVYEKQHTDFSKVKMLNKKDITPEALDGRNMICYYNATRKRLNKLMNDYHSAKANNVISLPYEGGDSEADKKDLPQDAFLYPGLPIIAHRNLKSKDDDELVMANNECFEVVDVDDSELMAVSKRINEDGEEYEHTITINTDEFHQHFLLNYIATTHKSQGATINNDVVVFDYERMTRNIRYTAITRVKKLSQIIIVDME